MTARKQRELTLEELQVDVCVLGGAMSDIGLFTFINTPAFGTIICGMTAGIKHKLWIRSFTPSQIRSPQINGLTWGYVDKSTP